MDEHGWTRGSSGATLEVSWDLSGGYLSWLGHVSLKRDLRLAAAALVLAFLCICVHARSIFLGVLGAAQIALSFPLAYYIYKALLGIPLFGPLHVIGIFVSTIPFNPRPSPCLQPHSACRLLSGARSNPNSCSSC